MQWKEITAERYTKALEAVRPMIWSAYGFLRGGKPARYRECRITKQTQPAYTPFITAKGKHWQGTEPMTVAEFAALDPNSVGPSN